MEAKVRGGTGETRKEAISKVVSSRNPRVMTPLLCQDVEREYDADERNDEQAHASEVMKLFSFG
jgi:hypothetical protein